MARELFTLQFENVHILPVLHERVEFARYVREAVRELAPAVVAVELPSEVGPEFEKGVERFPYLSFVANMAPDSGGGTATRTQTQHAFLFYRVEPSDPLAEAVRSAAEAGARVAYVDVFRNDYPMRWEPIPDSYAVFHLGLKKYFESYQEARDPVWNNPLDKLREEHMAWRLSHFDPGQTVLFVCGMTHAQGVLDCLREGRGKPAEEHPVPPLTLYQPSEHTIKSLSGELPYVTAVYEFARGGPGPDATWQDPPEEADEAPPPPRPPVPFEGFSSKDAVSALESLLGMKSGSIDELQLSPGQMKALHQYLSSLSEQKLSLAGLDELGAAPELTGVAPQTGGHARTFKFKTCTDRRSELHGVYGFLNGECRDQDRFLDRQRLFYHLFSLAGEFYEENTGDVFKRWHLRNINQFSRNYARLNGRLLPNLYEISMASRGCVDHNYAFEVHDLCTFYPWRDEASTLPSLDISQDGIELGGIKFKRWTLHRRLPRLRQMMKKLPIKPRAKEESPGDWASAMETGNICSYPPEDIVIEDYARYLQKKAIKMLSEEKTRVEPFSVSLLDGIDMRATLRNWVDGQKIYVREEQKSKGSAGSVVVIFDEDKQNKNYPWAMTWHGEHNQESDMAFFATSPRSKVIGKGIARCEYGGFCMTYPPRRLMDVWSDPYYGACKTKAEVLLFAAIDYCQDRHVVYVAAEPPRSYFRTLAARLGKKIVYVPIGSLSPVSLKKIRIFHVLSGHRYRKIAKDFIW